MEEEKLYLGDGVYVHFDGLHVVLSTSNGQMVTNNVFLNDKVLVALEMYLSTLRTSSI